MREVVNRAAMLVKEAAKKAAKSESGVVLCDETKKYE